jgi:hypothetical protein
MHRAAPRGRERRARRSAPRLAHGRTPSERQERGPHADSPTFAPSVKLCVPRTPRPRDGSSHSSWTTIVIRPGPDTRRETSRRRYPIVRRVALAFKSDVSLYARPASGATTARARARPPARSGPLVMRKGAQGPAGPIDATVVQPHRLGRVDPVDSSRPATGRSTAASFAPWARSVARPQRCHRPRRLRCAGC